MRKVLILTLAFVVTAMFAGTVNAQLILFADERATVDEVKNPVPPWSNEPCGGGKGDGDILRLQPRLPDDLHILAGCGDTSTGTLTVYGDFTGGNVGEVISSVGLNLDAAQVGGDYTLESAAIGDVHGELFDGTAVDGLSFKGVQVPVEDFGEGPEFDEAQGLGAGEQDWLFRVDFAAADRGDPGLPGLYDLGACVNNLLCTRVSEAGAGDLQLAMGYADCDPVDAGSGSDEATCGVLGSVVIELKGDYDHDGSVTNLDIQDFLDARAAVPGTLNVEDTWKGDFDCDYDVTNLDIQGFLDNRALP